MVLPGYIAAVRRCLSFARAGFERFWFAAADPRPLGFFRIGVAVLGLVQVVLIWSSLLQLYGNFGFVQWAVTEAAVNTWLPSIGTLTLVLYPYGVSSSACVYGVFCAYVLALVGLLIGWKTRLFAVGACLLYCLTDNSGYISLYGFDTMLHISLFYCVWMPVGASFSADQRLHGGPVQPSFLANVSLRTLQLHLCILYLDSGLAKLSGIQWRNGEALWRVLMEPRFSVFDASWLAHVPVVAKLACWTVLVIESGYGVLIWPAKTRPIWVIATVGLHLGIGILMGLWLFSLIMIVLTMTAFGFALLEGANRESAVRVC